MTGVDEMLRQQPAPTAELDDEAAARTDGLEQREDARRAVFGMEGEPLVMDPRQVGAVVRGGLGSHRHMVPQAQLGGRGRSGGRSGRAGTSPTLGVVKIGVILPAAEADGPGETPGWPAIRSFARAAEAQGLDSVWMFDHLFDQTEAGPIEGMHEAWTIVSAVAAATERVEIGTLVLCSSFRNPALVAKMAATADDVSGGRLILGLGAGWHDPEYEAFGFPKDHRVDRFEEALRIVVPLLRGETVSFAGRYGEARAAVLAPARS